MPRKSAALSFGSLRAKPPLASPGQRIGLLGGSFNPPHAAHLMISEIALRRLRLERVWWVVTPGNPLKDHNALPPLDARLAHCRQVARDSRITVTAFEEALPTAYTAATLAFLTRRLPAVRFVWLMGADNFASFHRWQHWRDIAGSMPMAVIDRPGFRHASLASRAARALARWRAPESEAFRLASFDPPAWTFLTGPLSPLSSTALRGEKSTMLRTRNAH